MKAIITSQKHQHFLSIGTEINGEEINLNGGIKYIVYPLYPTYSIWVLDSDYKEVK